MNYDLNLIESSIHTIFSTRLDRYSSEFLEKSQLMGQRLLSSINEIIKLNIKDIATFKRFRNRVPASDAEVVRHDGRSVSGGAQQQEQDSLLGEKRLFPATFDLDGLILEIGFSHRSYVL